MRQFAHRPLLEMNQMIHTRCLSILSGCTDNLSVNIISLNIGFNLVVYQIKGLVHRFIPAFSWQKIRPLLGGK